MSAERALSAGPPDAAAFAPFGRFLFPPARPGVRADYSECLAAAPGIPGRLHVNFIRPASLPSWIETVERHSQGWQIFLPLDVSRYIVVVMGSHPDGSPAESSARAFVAPGRVGVAYAPGVWHAGMIVLDRAGHFAVHWPRDDARPNEERTRLAKPFAIA